MKKNISFWIPFLFLALLIALSCLAPFLTPYSPSFLHTGHEKIAPSSLHWLGTDDLGRDLFSRLLYGGRLSLAVGLCATFVSFLLGGVLGLIGGYFRGKTDLLLQFLTDLTLCFPTLLLAIGIAVVLKPGFFSLVLALSLSGWAPFARLVRNLVLEMRERPFVEAARSVGQPSHAILIQHLLPNLAPLLMVTFTAKLGGFILSEASLSFLGLGPDPSVPSWGAMVHFGLDFIRYQPWISFFPGLAIFLTVASFNLLGDSLENSK